MNNNRLCAGLALLMCVTTVLMHAQPGSFAPAQNSADQVHPAVGDNPSGAVANAVPLPVVERYDTVEGARLLREAAERGDVATVRVLLAGGADANAAEMRCV